MNRYMVVAVAILAVRLVACSSGEPSTQPIVDGATVALWTFDEPAGQVLHEATGRHDGSAVNVVAASENGAWDFSRDSAYVRVPASEALDLADGFTIEARIRPTMIGPEASRSGTQSIVEKHMGDGGYLLVVTPEGHLAYWFETPSGRVADTTDVALEPRAWYSVAMSWDRVVVRIALDGETVLESAYDGVLPATMQDVFLGDDDTHNWGFHGDIDYIRILNVPRHTSN